MKKYICSLLCLCLLTLPACSKEYAAVSTTASAHQSETTQETQPLPTTEPIPTGKELLDGKKIIFIGNSFTYYGKCVLVKGQDVQSQSQRENDRGYFYQICKANGLDVNVTNFTFGSHQLIDFYSGRCAADRGHDGLDHFADIDDFYYDYVVLQAGSGPLHYEDILGECQPIMERFREVNPDVKFVFLVHHQVHRKDYVWRSDLKGLAQAGVLVVDWGKLVCDIINGETTVPGSTEDYDFYSFVISQSEGDGYHQNMLSGYITALMTYCAITGESAQGQPWRFAEDTNLNQAAIAAYRQRYYTYNTSTNFDTVLNSEADMTGIQQLIDVYLAAKAYETY